MKKTTTIFGALVILLLAGCSNGNFEKTRSGLMYKIISDKKNPLIKKGDIIKLHFTQKVKDSVQVSSYEQMPMYAQVDSVGPNYDPKEIFTLLRKGDSAIMIISGDTLFKRNQLPPTLSRKDHIVLTFRIVDVFTSDSAAQNDRMAEAGKAQAKQMEEMEKRNKEAEGLKAPKQKEIEDYLAANKIKYEKGPLGTCVVITDPGTGLKADSGRRVFVRYTGKSFPGFKQFESNMGPESQAYPVIIGHKEVIEGWEEGLQYFKKGGKGTLYVPFFLAYGSRPGPNGKPFESLVFDIQIDDVQDGGAPQGPPAPNR